ncbi:hypothetical protein TNIN_464501 [Trichonephila inaurata madagascariensis]|uniref:Uncharacterized protein n=1 Tax=Trichonephila inaurata madagascariensis TaxID=2747483 RepID=A0A8X6Y9S7_9ARAC|nr:hypothetical protein TNIN_464501 [Trichonephila inaurata madagascariensis]
MLWFREIGDLTVHEIEHAEKTPIKIVQAKFFLSENSFPNMNVEGIKESKPELQSGQKFIYSIILQGKSVFLLNGSISPTKLSCWITNSSRNIRGEILGGEEKGGQKNCKELYKMPTI